MAPAPENFDASLHQTIGSLNAKADQAQKDVSGIRHDVANLQQGITGLPAAVEEIVERLLGPVDKRLTSVESNLSDVQRTVIKWKTILAFIATMAAILGYALSQVVSLKKLFGVG